MLIDLGASHRKIFRLCPPPWYDMTWCVCRTPTLPALLDISTCTAGSVPSASPFWLSGHLEPVKAHYRANLGCWKGLPRGDTMGWQWSHSLAKGHGEQWTIKPLATGSDFIWFSATVDAVLSSASDFFWRRRICWSAVFWRLLKSSLTVPIRVMLKLYLVNCKVAENSCVQLLKCELFMLLTMECLWVQDCWSNKTTHLKMSGIWPLWYFVSQAVVIPDST